MLTHDIFLARISRARCQKWNWIQHSHQRAISHLQNQRDTTQKFQQQHHHNWYPILNWIEHQRHIQQRGECASHPPHNIVILRTPTSSLTMQDVHLTLPIISRYCLGWRRVKMTKKKAMSLFKEKDTRKIPHNAGYRRQSREGGIIPWWTNNRKIDSPLKIIPTNKKMKGKGKAPTKVGYAYTTATRKTPAINLP